MSAPVSAAEPGTEPDLMTFAGGVLPVAVGGDAQALGITLQDALLLVDGNPTGRILSKKPGTADYEIELLYELPAPTRFTQFAVPRVLETPSPSQTFVGQVTVSGASDQLDGDYQILGEVTLTVHETPDELTRFAALDTPVRWLKVTLSGGLDIQRDKTFFEFSELQAFGLQESAPLNEGFSGQWRGRGMRLALQQDGTLVSGCYDRNGELKGTVQGRMLFASGLTPDDQVRSAFVLTVSPDGELSGLRSSNGAPFRPFDGSPSEDAGTACGPVQPVSLGCGDTVYGLNFAFDSASLLPESTAILQRLFTGLEASDARQIAIEGHTSSEGSEAYNLQLSERRANAVVKALVERGMDIGRLRAQGFGEGQPVASNDDESGRMLNRRVAVRCAD